MIKQHFSLLEAFSFGWKKFLQHYWYVFLSSFIITIIMSAVWWNTVLSVVVALLASVSIVHTTLAISRNHSFSFESLFSPLLSPKRVGKFLALALIMSLPFMAILLCLVILFTGATTGMATGNKALAFLALVAGMISTVLVFLTAYLTVRLKFIAFVVVEHPDATITNLLKNAYDLTKKQFLNVFVFIVMVAVLNVAVVIIFFPLLIVSLPVSLFASAHVYDRLRDHMV
jgi:hypothetical protein